MTKTHILILAVVMCGLFFCAPRADAALVTISITAEVTNVYDTGALLEERINVGDIITGTYTYDTSTPDLDPRINVGCYRQYEPPCGVSLNVGGFVFRTDPDNVDFLFEIRNNFRALYDRYKLISENNLPLPNSTQILYIRFSLIDDSMNALPDEAGDALPTTAPVLDDWLIGAYNLTVVCRGAPGAYFKGRLTSAIPEPATILLLAFGGLALLRKRKA